MTLDYEEDLEFFTKIYNHFHKIHPEFSLEDALDWLNENEDIILINSHMTQKTPDNLNLNVSLNI